MTQLAVDYVDQVVAGVEVHERFDVALRVYLAAQISHQVPRLRKQGCVLLSLRNLVLQDPHELVEEAVLVDDLVQLLLGIGLHQGILVGGRLDVVRHLFAARLVVDYVLFFEIPQLQIVKNTHLLDGLSQIYLCFITQKRLLRNRVLVLEIHGTGKVEAS